MRFDDDEEYPDEYCFTDPNGYVYYDRFRAEHPHLWQNDEIANAVRHGHELGTNPFSIHGYDAKFVGHEDIANGVIAITNTFYCKTQEAAQLLLDLFKDDYAIEPHDKEYNSGKPIFPVTSWFLAPLESVVKRVCVLCVWHGKCSSRFCFQDEKKRRLKESLGLA